MPTKTPPHTIRTIGYLYSKGMTTRSIAERAGVSNGTVSKVLRRDLGVSNRRYTPDFEVEGTYVEVHGWCDEATKSRIEEFAELYPNEILEIVGPAEMVQLGLIPGTYASHPQARLMTDFRFRFQQTTA